MDPSVCCETRLYAAAMMLEALATKLRLLRLDHALTRARLVESLEDVQACKYEIDGALECAADEVSIMDRAAVVVAEVAR